MKINVRDYKLEQLKQTNKTNLSDVLKNIKQIEDSTTRSFYKTLILSSLNEQTQPEYKLIHLPTKIDVTFKKQNDIKMPVQLRDQIKQTLIPKIKSIRATNKDVVKKVVYEKTGNVIESIGGVFLEPGQIVKAMNFPDDPYTHKTPKIKSQNYFGVELEFNTKGDRKKEQNEMAEYFKQNRLSKYVCISSDHCGHELKLLLPETNFKVIIKQVLEYLNKQGFKADTSCGMHVHIDMRNRNHKLVYKNLFKFQQTMLAMVPKPRRENKFCVPNKYSSFDEHHRNAGSRYYVINTHSIDKHKTLEVRLHHGTLDYYLISNWLKLLSKIANLKTEVDMVETVSIKDAKSHLKLRDYELKTLEKRIKAFA
jgi:hypothetical protein